MQFYKGVKLQSKVRRISKFMDTMIAIKEGKSKVKNEQDFENLYFEMEWMVKNI